MDAVVLLGCQQDAGNNKRAVIPDLLVCNRQDEVQELYALQTLSEVLY